MHAGVYERLSVRAWASERDFLRKSFDFNIFVNDVIRENMAKRAHETNVQ